jgi:hypothetical protein
MKHYKKYIGSLWRQAPYVLRITEWKGYPIPMLVAKERFGIIEEGTLPLRRHNPQVRKNESGKLVERGHIGGASQRRCLPIVRRIVERVPDNNGVPLDLDRYLTQEGLKLRLNLPLNEEAGAKLCLIFRLQERVNDLDRVELIARRAANFSREEAEYWLSRATSYGSDANRWAVSGLRLILGGQPQDPGVVRMLEQFRTKT